MIHHTETNANKRSPSNINQYISEQFFRYINIKKTVGFIIGLFIFTLILYVHFSLKDPAIAFSSYHKISNSPCNIYAAVNKNRLAEIQDVMKNLSINCKSESTIYYTVPLLHSSHNIVYCRFYSDKKQKCVSYTIIDAAKDKS